YKFILKSLIFYTSPIEIELKGSASFSKYKELITKKAVSLLLNIKGVLYAKPLKRDEVEELLKAEEFSEKKVVFGMCRTYNKGVRLALERDVSIAVVINTSEFIYPHEPQMRILYNDLVIGEEIYDKRKVEELKKSRSNVFLWNNFVIYNNRLASIVKRRDEMRLTYLPRSFPELMNIMEGIEDCIFAEPSMEGDAVIKKLLSFSSKDPVVGSCVVGFNISKRSNI
ncbi:MAG: hypothetical protein ACUVTL_09240, partial [Thermoproteota archaeon]